MLAGTMASLTHPGGSCSFSAIKRFLIERERATHVSVMGEHSLLYYLGFLKENSILSHIVDNSNMVVRIAVSNPFSYSGFTTSLWGEVLVSSHSSLNPLPLCPPIIRFSPCPFHDHWLSSSHHPHLDSRPLRFILQTVARAIT